MKPSTHAGQSAFGYRGEECSGSRENGQGDDGGRARRAVPEHTPAPRLPRSLWALGVVVALAGCADGTQPPTETPSDSEAPDTGTPEITPTPDPNATPTPVGTPDPNATPTPAGPTPTLGPNETPTPVPDADKDGSPDSLDCDDSDALTFPGAPELCDRLDNDCDGKLDESLYQGGEDKSSCGIYSLMPATGAMGMPSSLVVTVDFELKSYVDYGTITGRLVGQDGTIVELQNPKVDPDIATRIRFNAASLPTAQQYSLEVVSTQSNVDPPGSGWIVKGRALLTRQPPCGLVFETSEGMQITRMGSTSEGFLGVINSQLESNPVPLGLAFVGMDPLDLFPYSDVDVLLGVMAGSGQGGAYYVDPYYGFPTWLAGVSIDVDGHIVTPKQNVSVLVPANDTIASMFTTDMVLSGQLSTSGSIGTYLDYRITGVVKQTDLHKMLVETQQTSIESFFTMDLDLNDDGIADAASLEITAAPTLATLLNCTE